MATRAAQINFVSTTANSPISATYDSSKIMLGAMCKYDSTYKYVSPKQIHSFAFGDVVGASANVIYVSNGSAYNKPFIFLGDGSAVAQTRRIYLVEHDVDNETFYYKGYITVTPPAVNHVFRGLRFHNHVYTVGTVSASGTCAVGNGTAFSAYRPINVGARIGFGSSAATAITAWYEITGISGDTDIRFSGSVPGTGWPASTPYIIESINGAIITCAATLASGGLTLIKGLRPELFTIPGTTIAAGISADRRRACYWIPSNSANGVGNELTGSVGICLCGSSPTNLSASHPLYVINSSANNTFNVAIFDLARELTGLSGSPVRTNTPYSGTTSAYTTVSGVITPSGNGKIATLSSGPGSGIPSLYFSSTSRIVQVPTSALTSGTVLAPNIMQEIVPGTNTTVWTTTQSATQTTVVPITQIDSLFITTSANGNYVTKFKLDGSQYDRMCLYNTLTYNGLNALSGYGTNFATFSRATVYTDDFNGWLYAYRDTTSLSANNLYAIPAAADWAHQTCAYNSQQGTIILPAISTPNAQKLTSVSVNASMYAGNTEYGFATEPFRVYARTGGISDNTGSWTLIGDNGDLTSFSPSAQVQFKLEFKIFGTIGIVSKIYGVTVTYEDTATDSHYTPSYSQSDLANKRFAWRQTALFGAGLPRLKVILTDITDPSSPTNLLVDDVSAVSPVGTFEYATSALGGWSAWTSAADAVGNYVRYTPSSMADNKFVKASLVQY